MSSLRGPGPGWTVLVTGASSGLGRALALELARAGCSLILTGRDSQRLEQTAWLVDRPRSEVSVLTADLSSTEGVADLTTQIAQLGRPVDALVNNAGAGRAGLWAEGSSESDSALVGLLIEAPLALTRFLLAGWRERGRGAVLNVASTAAFQPGPQTAVYYAAKTFLMSWSLALAREERSWLPVTTLCPGALVTGFAASAGRRPTPGATGPEGVARLAVRGWQRGRGLVVPGLSNKLTVFLSRLAPPTWSAAVVEAIQRSLRPGS